MHRGISQQPATYATGDQLQSQGNTSYSYDANGRLANKLTTVEEGGTQLTTYIYSSLGQLLQVDTPEQSIEYRHNALGQRVAKLVNGQVTEKYLWRDLTTLLAIYDASGNVKQRFEHTLGHTPTSFTQEGQRYFIQSDHLGSPRVITDGSGNVVKAIDYDSYGNIIHDSNENFEIPFGFAGGLYDKDTGLIRFGFRDYDPGTGRWTARDPIGFAGGDTNLYGYVLGDPVNWIDTKGLSKLTINLTNGTTISINNPTAKGLIATLGMLPSNSISNFQLLGHGTSQTICISAGGNCNDFIFESGDIYSGSEKVGNIEDILKDKLNKDSQIKLEGCDNATGDENITKFFSDMFPDIPVIGGVGNQYGIENNWLFGNSSGSVGIKKHI